MRGGGWWRVDVLASRLADRLLGSLEAPPQPARAEWLLRYVAVAVGLVAIMAWRRPDLVSTPQFWAEDSTTYFLENLALGFPATLARLYNGYPYFAQRVIAAAGGLVPFTAAPGVYVRGAFVVTAFALAAFTAPRFRHLVRSDVLRVLFVVGVVLLPTDQEMMGTLANLGWWIAIPLSLLPLMRWPAASCQLVGLGVLAAAAILTTPLAAIVLPLWALRAWRAARLGDRRSLVASLVLVATTIAVMGASWRTLPPGPGGVLSATVGDDVRFAVRHVGDLLAPARPPAVPDPSAASAGAAAMCALIGLLCWRGRGARGPTVLIASALFTAFVVEVVVSRPLLPVLPWQTVPFRYRLFPQAMVLLALVAAVDGVARPGERAGAAACVVALLAWTWTPLFTVPPLKDADWRYWAAVLERRLEVPNPVPLTIPMNPPWNPLVVHDRTPPVGLPAAPSQTFTATCDGVSEVRVQLSPGSARGRMFVVSVAGGDVGTRRVVVDGTRLAPEGWLSAYFAPLWRSTDRPFTVGVAGVPTLAGLAYACSRRETLPPALAARLAGVAATPPR